MLKFVILDFFADWCPPCKMMAPLVQRVEKEYEGIEVRRVNIDEEKELAKKYKIEAVPTLVFLIDGGEVGRHVGAVDERGVKELFKDAFIAHAKTYTMRWVEEYASKEGYLVTQDPQRLSELIEALALSLLKFGKNYCPCRIREEENICPCIHHKREIEEKGHCLCGLFISNKSSR